MLQLLSFFVSGFGLLLCLIAIPLAAGKTRPNHYYGFRTKRTLSDPVVWDLVNRHAGKTMLYAGGSSLLLGVAMLLASPLPGALDERLSALLGLAAILGPVGVALVSSIRFLRRLP
jgi:uncharacterized membrane protein